MIIFYESFENPPLVPGTESVDVPEGWTRQFGQTFLVGKENTDFYFGNHDGVVGNQFMALGNALNKAHIYCTLSTVPGESYRVSYNYAFSDEFRLGGGTYIMSSTFKTEAIAYYGLIPWTHQGEVRYDEDIEIIASATHSAILPAVRDYELGSWSTYSYDFIAKSDTTRFKFTHIAATRFSAVGVVDSILVETIPEPDGACLLAGLILSVFLRRR